MIFNLNLFLYLLVYLPPGFLNLRKHFEGMVFMQFQIVFSCSNYIYQVAAVLRGSNFLCPQSGCDLIVVYKMQKKMVTTIFSFLIP